MNSFRSLRKTVLTKVTAWISIKRIIWNTSERGYQGETLESMTSNVVSNPKAMLEFMISFE